MKKNKGLAKEGYDAKGEKPQKNPTHARSSERGGGGGRKEKERGKNPKKPLPAGKVRRGGGGDGEMRRKSANARKINRPRQLYQYKQSRERAIEEEKPYL